MKTHKKEKFGFLDKEAKEGDSYFNVETRLTSSFPFLKMKVVVEYKFINGEWVEQEK